MHCIARLRPECCIGYLSNLHEPYCTSTKCFLALGFCTSEYFFGPRSRAKLKPLAPHPWNVGRRECCTLRTERPACGLCQCCRALRKPVMSVFHAN